MSHSSSAGGSRRRNHAVNPLKVGEIGEIDHQAAWTFPQLDLDACLQSCRQEFFEFENTGVLGLTGRLAGRFCLSCTSVGVGVIIICLAGVLTAKQLLGLANRQTVTDDALRDSLLLGRIGRY